MITARVSSFLMMYAAAGCGVLWAVPLGAQTPAGAAGDVHAFRRPEQKRYAQIAERTRAEDPAKIAEQRKYDVSYYGVNLSVDPGEETIAGSVTVRGLSTDDNLAAVILDLDDALTVRAVSGGNVLSFSHLGDRLSVLFITPLTIGERFDFTVDYGGTPEAGGFGSFVFDTRNGSPEPLVWTLSEPFFARTWWPCKDLPEDKADSADIVITVPEGLTAVSNGTLSSVRSNGDGTATFSWHEKYPIAPYLVSLTASQYDYSVEYFRYSAVDSMPIEYYITPEKAAGAFGEFSGLPETRFMLEVFSNLFGPYPFLDEKYAQVEFGWSGGMEHQTASSLNVTESGAPALLVAHELAHQWWGDMVTCRNWNDIWLNEGFATYAEALYLLARDGSPAALNEYMNQIKRPPGSWGTLYRTDTSDFTAILDNTVYDKGAWVLHMLRNIVGYETFFTILREYATRPAHAYGTADTRDFQKVCEEVSGDDFDWFFDQWVYRPGRPQYLYSWKTGENEGPYDVSVVIRQTQQEAPFAMPLEIFVHGSSRTDIFPVDNSRSYEEYVFTVSEQPLSVTIDDSNRVLKEVELGETNSPGEQPGDFTLIRNYPNPFNPATVIEFKTRTTARVTIAIYSVTGRKVATVLSEELPPGLYPIPWDGTNDEGEKVAGGIYFVKMSAGSFSDVRKMMLVK